MKCPYKKIVVVQDQDERDISIIKKVTTGFAECYGNECPFYRHNSFGTVWCERCENESKTNS